MCIQLTNVYVHLPDSGMSVLQRDMLLMLTSQGLGEDVAWGLGDTGEDKLKSDTEVGGD